MKYLVEYQVLSFFNDTNKPKIKNGSGQNFINFLLLTNNKNYNNNNDKCQSCTIRILLSLSIVDL